MEVTFQRKLQNELMTTYLPSFFLLGICYATIFFKKFYFEAAVTVNLTVMLVATTLFISVMDKLPPVSYLRLVDIWLVGVQVIPFVGVILLTFIELNTVGKMLPKLNTRTFRYFIQRMSSIIMDSQEMLATKRMRPGLKRKQLTERRRYSELLSSNSTFLCHQFMEYLHLPIGPTEHMSTSLSR